MTFTLMYLDRIPGSKRNEIFCDLFKSPFTVQKKPPEYPDGFIFPVLEVNTSLHHECFTAYKLEVTVQSVVNRGPFRNYSIDFIVNIEDEPDELEAIQSEIHMNVREGLYNTKERPLYNLSENIRDNDPLDPEFDWKNYDIQIRRYYISGQSELVMNFFLYSGTVDVWLNSSYKDLIFGIIDTDADKFMRWNDNYFLSCNFGVQICKKASKQQCVQMNISLNVSDVNDTPFELNILSPKIDFDDRTNKYSMDTILQVDLPEWTGGDSLNQLFPQILVWDPDQQKEEVDLSMLVTCSFHPRSGCWKEVARGLENPFLLQKWKVTRKGTVWRLALNPNASGILQGLQRSVCYRYLIDFTAISIDDLSKVQTIFFVVNVIPNKNYSDVPVFPSRESRYTTILKVNQPWKPEIPTPSQFILLF